MGDMETRGAYGKIRGDWTLLRRGNKPPTIVSSHGEVTNLGTETSDRRALSRRGISGIIALIIGNWI